MNTIEKTSCAICPIEDTLNLVDGKWKLTILHYLLTDKTLRFSELQQRMPGITQRMLTAKLRELESYGIVTRKVYPVVPPKVEYSLTNLGKSLRPVIDALSDWDRKHNEELKAASKTNL